MKKGQKLNYIGLGFLGFDPEDTEMIYISKIGGCLKVTYKKTEMAVRVHEVELKND